MVGVYEKKITPATAAVITAQDGAILSPLLENLVVITATGLNAHTPSR